jgi:hypothetical protein
MRHIPQLRAAVAAAAAEASIRRNATAAVEELAEEELMAVHIEDK